MDKDYLIKKWLDHALNAEELEAFKKLDDYETLIKLSTNIQEFEAPNFEENEEFHKLLEKIEAKKNTNSWIKPILRIAAIAIIALGSLWFFKLNKSTTITTVASQKTTINLPDASQVTLNALTDISFTPNDWKKDRLVNLDGEAFFKVAKGSSFDVKTSSGIITVYGTQFNVKQRNNYFEVICYEGLVGVTYKGETQRKLKPGDCFSVINNNIVFKELKDVIKPYWINNESYFKSIPLRYVLKEFERQYDVHFDTKGLDLDQIFTGTFTHNNYEIAIKSITLPLHLTYSKINNTIILKRG